VHDELRDEDGVPEDDAAEGRCGRGRERRRYLVGEGTPASVGWAAEDRPAPETQITAAMLNTTIVATSMKNAWWANGATHESLNPKSPFSTDMRNPIMVDRANPTPSAAAQTRRTATIITPRRTAVIDWRRKRGPMVAMWR
jgi:hypothetical protein